MAADFGRHEGRRLIARRPPFTETHYGPHSDQMHSATRDIPVPVSVYSARKYVDADIVCGCLRYQRNSIKSSDPSFLDQVLDTDRALNRQRQENVMMTAVLAVHDNEAYKTGVGSYSIWPKLRHFPVTDNLHVTRAQ